MVVSVELVDEEVEVSDVELELVLVLELELVLELVLVGELVSDVRELDVDDALEPVLVSDWV